MLYFAYGSNLNKARMKWRCPSSKPLFRACLPNYKLTFAGYSIEWGGGTATIHPFEGKSVFGAVYEVSEKDLELLYKCEGVPYRYKRAKVKVYTETGELLEVVTYIMKEEYEESKPSSQYLSFIEQGFRDWGISIEVLKQCLRD